MARISITVDGRMVAAASRMTVLEAVLHSGTYIPHLCADPDLRPYGACRLCIVEIEGIRGLPASCTVQASEGMVVRTRTPQVEAIQRSIVELLLADHRGDCLTCPKNTRCDLQTVAAYVGVRPDRFPKSTRVLPLDDSNPFFSYDPNKCILCGKCVRVCDEVQGLAAITWAGRGYATRVSSFMGRPLADSLCESCGQCEAKCPVGALSVKGYQQPDRRVQTICPYCGTGCGLLLQVRGGRVVGAEGDPSSPVSHGSLCVKGRFGMDFVSHPDRLVRPLVRKNGHLVESTWDEALDITATRLAEHARMEFDQPSRFGALSSAKVTNEENYLFQKLVRVVMGTNSVDHCARL